MPVTDLIQVYAALGRHMIDTTESLSRTLVGAPNAADRRQARSAVEGYLALIEGALAIPHRLWLGGINLPIADFTLGAEMNDVPGQTVYPLAGVPDLRVVKPTDLLFMPPGSKTAAIPARAVKVGKQGRRLIVDLGGLVPKGKRPKPGTYVGALLVKDEAIAVIHLAVEAPE